MADYTGTPGNDDFTGTSGNDTFNMGRYLTGSDRINGGQGNDTLVLSGDYSTTPLVTSGTQGYNNTLTSIENVVLAAGGSYNLTFGYIALPPLFFTFDGSQVTSNIFLNISGIGANTRYLTGGAGDDTFVLGSEFRIKDRIEGGAGYDKLELSGSFGAVTFLGVTITNIEELDLSGNFAYNITTANGNVASGATLVVDASGVTGGKSVTFNASVDSNSQFHFIGGGGVDTFTGGAIGDIFDLGSTLTAADRINGGAGNDRLLLSGDYATTPLVLDAMTLVSIEAMTLADGGSYDITLGSDNLSGGTSLTIDGSALSASNTVRLDVSSDATDNLILTGGAGNDQFVLGAAFSSGDHINGGAGYDKLILDGATSLSLTPANMTGIEEIDLTGNFAYSIATADGNVGNGATLVVDASAVTGSNSVTFNAAADTNSIFHFIGGGGVDTFTGGARGDTFDMGGTLTAADQLNGGAGNDTLVLNGDYASTPLVMGAGTLTSIEQLTLLAGPTSGYNITLGGNNISGGNTFTIDGTAVTGNMRFDVSSDTVDTLVLLGGSQFVMGGAFSSDDRIVGGAGYNTIFLDGDYGQGIIMNANNVQNINVVMLSGAHDYKITDKGVALPAGAGSISFDGSGLVGAAHFTFDGSGTTYALALGAGANSIENWTGSTAGDQFFVGAGFTAASTVTGGGGTGYDDVYFTGDYSAGLTLGAKTITDVAQITFQQGFSYNITTNDGTVSAGATVTIWGGDLTASEHLVFNGSAETDGFYSITGGAGSDTLTGGQRADSITGGLGADLLSGGGGRNRFYYAGVTDSSGVNYDTITDFNFQSDTISLPETVTAMDALVTGTLSTATFEADLTSAVTSAKMGADHALLFKATGGDLTGAIFLIVDANNNSGYQAGSDYVIRLEGNNLGRFTLSNLTSHS